MSTDTTAAPTTPQVAINDIGSEEDFLAAIDQTIKYFNDGDIVEGTIVKVDRDEVLLDIGYKTEGVIPSRELSIKHDVDPAEVGEFVEALVLQKEDKEGRLILSKKRAQYERAWGTIEALKEADEPVEGTVIEVVKGGLILDIGLRGFLPASLVEMRRVRDLQPYVGRKIEAKIIELDKNRNNVVLSRRAWLEQTQSEVRSEFLNQLQRGQVRKGVVSSVVNFGAFVDLGGVDGLVHVSELSWKHIDHPSEVVEVGQEVTVEVLDVDLDRERVSLSLKATQEDPWRLYARTHAIGQIVPGKVTKLVPFGAFVRVEEGIEGLVHISELAERHVEVPEQVVQVGDDAMVKVIDIDLDRRRISLSLKQANEGMTTETEFDPTRYGMAAEYDDQGNYIYPEGFDVDSGEWKEGFDEARSTWEKQYSEAQARYEQHMAQIRKAAEAEAEGGDDVAPANYSSGGGDERPSTGGSGGGQAESGGSLASDEQLAALREKLSGGA
ncbi:SSU ribosomal protein S1p [Pseudonocardia sp. Ae168_Ps1]|uniref:30S ribosomal protein S1 n=1 Tax=unclassified Pseudonocardia TaxID=2619320 RepID=UPI00094B218D|nr:MULTISPECIES: 30S ribosomal protein S1 [unclassified Pseudonocardia]OLL70905.1 SSU ribosomal protein S1p [Pseudonocardia sp. Ae168_Ps1]OLL77542.1 SSU ribosomal protein S1p [Pseudonocardia sp. Ae150A_Ps1]